MPTHLQLLCLYLCTALLASRGQAQVQAPTAAEILANSINGKTVHEFRGYYKREHSFVRPYTGEQYKKLITA